MASVPLPPYRACRVTGDCLDGSPSIPAFTNGRLWNGFQQPLFSRPSVLQLALLMPGQVEFDASGTAVIVIADDGEPFLVNGQQIEVNGRRIEVFAVGSGWWCWEEADTGIGPATDAPLDKRFDDVLFGTTQEEFDALEVHGVRNVRTPAGENVGIREVDDVNPELFSVYVHFRAGGVECVGDHGTLHLALKYARELANRFGCPIHNFAPMPVPPRAPSTAV